MVKNSHVCAHTACVMCLLHIIITRQMIIIVGVSLSEVCGACSKRPVCVSEHTTMGTVSAL